MKNLQIYCNVELGKIYRLKKTGWCDVGYKAKNGYINFTIRSKTYLVHRFVWQWLNGPIEPGYVINHKNFDKTDNRICNLELVTLSQNQQWAQRQVNNTSGVANVKFRKGRDKYLVYFKVKSIVYYFGHFGEVNKKCIDARNAGARLLNQKFGCKFTYVDYNGEVLI